MNTTLRCVLLAIYETSVATCASYVCCAIPSLLIASMTYSKACYLDIKSLFAQVDQLSERKNVKRSEPKNSETFKNGQKFKQISLNIHQRMNTELKMLERCKEAVDLHRKVNR